MAVNNNNIIISGTSGQIGKQLVLKQYSFGTVVSKYPDMSKVQPSALQRKGRNKFAEAVAYAQNIIRNRELKEAYKLKLPKKVKSIYHYAIKEYLQKNKQ